jgi:imidazolonepropionase-like amidohydrolase
MDAIQSATSRAATMLDMDGKIGVIAPGAFADVIAVSGDPSRDIKALGTVQFVMKNGEVFKSDTVPQPRH